jgi:hypothetical protein
MSNLPLEEKYMDVLQNIEFAIHKVYQETPSLRIIKSILRWRRWGNPIRAKLSVGPFLAAQPTEC